MNKVHILHLSVIPKSIQPGQQVQPKRQFPHHKSHFGHSWSLEACQGEQIQLSIQSDTSKSTKVMAGPQDQLFCIQESAKTVTPQCVKYIWQHSLLQKNQTKQQPCVPHCRGADRLIPTEAEVPSFCCTGCSQFCSLQFLTPPLLLLSLSSLHVPFQPLLPTSLSLTHCRWLLLGQCQLTFEL